jgi:hypothetical protein
MVQNNFARSDPASPDQTRRYLWFGMVFFAKTGFQFSGSSPIRHIRPDQENPVTFEINL